MVIYISEFRTETEMAAQQTRWIGEFFNNLATEFNATGRTEDAKKIYQAFKILNLFFSAVHVPVSFYDATREEDNATKNVAVIKEGTFKVVNDSTVSVTCVPGAMITWQVVKNMEPNQRNERKDKSNSPTDSADIDRL